MYTGDDFNYAELIAGDEDGHSDALLGIFDAIAPVASAALEALGRGSDNEFFDLLEPTVPLSRHIFKAPTRFYKTGVVFLAYLNGLQDHFVMVGGQQSARSLQHLAELFRLADQARVLADPDEAAVADEARARRARPRLSHGRARADPPRRGRGLRAPGRLPLPLPLRGGAGDRGAAGLPPRPHRDRRPLAPPAGRPR